MLGCSWRGHLRGVHIQYCPCVLRGNTYEGYIFITARVFLEGTPAMGTYSFHYCSGVLGGDTYDGYMFACEAAWRIFGFEIHYRIPSAERLSFHLPGEQQVLYNENSDLETIIHKLSVGHSMFEGWMKMNELYPIACELTYAEFPTKYVWNAPKRIWMLRKQGRSIGRIHSVPISTGDAYYCRMLLNSTKGCKTHDDIKKVKELMLSRGSSLRNWPEMPYPNNRYITEFGNHLIYSETDYNPAELQFEYERLYVSLTTEHKVVYDTIMSSVETGTGGVYFLYRYGGTGKTFLWKILATGIRRRGDIVLNVASSGIASLLMSRGQTAHSRFHIPINVDETSTCSISAQSDLGALLKKCKLIIWDEAPMENKLCFEALDRSFRDILRKNRYDKCKHPFGNMTMVFGGDFRQVLPVIPKGSWQDIVSASLKESCCPQILVHSY
ncbi:ATP-dependent DNA helicase PIF1-like protein [Tanacetum coccineum]